MARSTKLVFLCLAGFLVLFPLTLVKPGWPPGLKADEPAYYLMAMSLAFDGDVRVDLGDLRRLFDEFPDHVTRNVILMTDDGWNTVWFGKPYVYSLFAAPWARLFGSNGLVAFNMALFLGMVYLGTRYLARFNPEWLALLFSAGFFFLSAGFAYVFWIQPEVFNMAAVTASLYLGLTKAKEPWARGPVGWLARPEVRLAVAGAALVLAVYNKPMFAALGLPVAFVLLYQRRLRHLGAWLAGGTLCLALLVGGAVALTGHPSAYLGVARAGVKVCSPDEMPVTPLPPPPPVAEAAPAEKGSMEDTRRAAWSWILRLPEVDGAEALEHAGFFLWGRHTGLVPYCPFAVFAAFFFLLHGRRSAERWVLLAALATVAVFLLLWIPFNWHGGGGFVGNRYFVNVYPGFLFLVTRVSPSSLVVAAWTLGGLLLGPTVFSPLGRTVPWPTLQAHTRNFPFGLFPLELTVKGIPGYHEASWAGLRFTGRQDVFLPRGPRAWVGGATETELWIQAAEPIDALVFQVSSFAAPNEVSFELGDTTEVLAWSASEAEARRRFELRPGEPDKVLHKDGRTLLFYRLVVKARHGEVREWTRQYPPRDCFYFPWPESTLESAYVGAEVTVLGTPERLARDLYAVSWGKVRAPEKVKVGKEFKVRTRVTNASAETWPDDLPTRVHLSYHWLDEGGAEVVRNGLRTPLGGPVVPGGEVDVWQDVRAPDAPGRYLLEIDLVYEEVSWFAERTDDVVRLPVEVTSSSPDGV